MRTLVYIDGINLYFGCLRQATQCRWLDVEALVLRLINEHDPGSEVTGIKFFAAPIKAALSPRGIASCIAQQDYLLALKAHCPRVQVVQGEYFIVSGSYHEDKQPVDFTRKLRVLRPEEKQTDVNLALHMLSDATDGLAEQLVLISNDSDCVPILTMIRARHPEIRLGVIAPILHVSPQRQPSAELASHSHWTRRSIREDELAASQLPNGVKTRKRYIRKPAHWS